MEIWLTRCSSFDEESASDAAFWRQFSPDERVAILERMRLEWLEEHDRCDEGLRRTAQRILAS